MSSNTLSTRVTSSLLRRTSSRADAADVCVGTTSERSDLAFLETAGSQRTSVDGTKAEPGNWADVGKGVWVREAVAAEGKIMKGKRAVIML